MRAEDPRGISDPQEFYDQLEITHGSISGTAKTMILGGKAGRPKQSGWSRTSHFGVSGAGRINYQPSAACPRVVQRREAATGERVLPPALRATEDGVAKDLPVRV